MSDATRFAATTAAFGVLTLAHAAYTWPPRATLALFGGGALVAFLAEATVVRAGWLSHHVGPRAAGVPLYVLFGWTGAVYVALRVALLAAGGWSAATLAAVVAATADGLTDHRGVEAELWTYTDDLPGPRYRGVPWWNFVGWLCVAGATAALAVPFL